MNRTQPLALSLLLLAALASACDSSSSESLRVDAVVADRSSIVFNPDSEIPAVAISLNVSNSENTRLTFRWNASGGTFESTGTTSYVTDSSSVRWSPDRLAGEYRIEVTASDGEQEDAGSVIITAEPSLNGSWIGALDLVDEKYDRAGFCMQSLETTAAFSYEYIEVMLGGDMQSRGTGGRVRGASSFDYPNLTADFAPSGSTSFDRPVLLTGLLSTDGTQLQIELEMESGRVRGLALERTPLCSSSTLRAYVQ